MLKENQKVAIYLEGHLHSEYGKMGIGAIRYLSNNIVAVIDSKMTVQISPLNMIYLKIYP